MTDQLKRSLELRQARNARMVRWRKSAKGQAWLDKQKRARADLKARKLAVLRAAGLA